LSWTGFAWAPAIDSNSLTKSLLTDVTSHWPQAVHVLQVVFEKKF